MFAAPATRAHMRNFLTARREGKRPVADIEQGHISSACCILANLSMKLGRQLAEVENANVTPERKSFFSKLKEYFQTGS